MRKMVIGAIEAPSRDSTTPEQAARACETRENDRHAAPAQKLG